MEKLAALKQYFGHSAFRPGQETMVDASTLGTGCLWRHAHRRRQIGLLSAAGSAASGGDTGDLTADLPDEGSGHGIGTGRDFRRLFLNSSQTTAAQREVLRGLKAGAYKLLYVAPERLTADSFLDMIHELETVADRSG